ncbi:MAG: flagellar biosynthesis anti-sigma factor FlgM [Candidatus Ruminococcus intestinipullorum]|nr:flagellar biosynthesis anti-sigma factor FlgM [Candidatus Ruminococcus intestinipullorum]
MEVKGMTGCFIYKTMMERVKNSKTQPDTWNAIEKSSIDKQKDAIVISNSGIRQQQAAKATAIISQEMEYDIQPDRLAQLKQQIQAGTYHISSEVLAECLF